MLRHLLLILAAAGALIASPLAAQSGFASGGARILDQAGILSTQFEDGLEARLSSIEARASVQMVVVTIDTLDGVEPKAVADTMLDRWLEAADANGNAAILLLAPNDRTFTVQVRTKVNDAEAAKKDLEREGVARALLEDLRDLIQPAVVPHFKENQWEAGLSAGINALEAELANYDAHTNSRRGET